MGDLCRVRPHLRWQRLRPTTSRASSPDRATQRTSTALSRSYRTAAPYRPARGLRRRCRVGVQFRIPDKCPTRPTSIADRPTSVVPKLPRRLGDDGRLRHVSPIQRRRRVRDRAAGRLDTPIRKLAEVAGLASATGHHRMLTRTGICNHKWLSQQVIRGGSLEGSFPRF